MEYKTKFKVGDIVYSKEFPDHGAMKIYRTEITDSDDGCCVAYWAIYGTFELRKRFIEDDLSKENTKPKPKSIYDLERGYWPIYWLDSEGCVFVGELGYDADMQTIEQGNVFLTREEAEKEAKRRMIHQQLKKLAGGYEFKPDEDNFYIYYDYICDGVRWSYTHRYKESGMVYFETSENIENAIKEIGRDKLKKDYFGIDD